MVVRDSLVDCICLIPLFSVPLGSSEIATHCGFPTLVCAGEGASLDGGNGLRSLGNALSKLLRVSSGNTRIIKFGSANHSHRDPCFLFVSPVGNLHSGG